MVGRVIGKSGETIKALQTYTGALIQASAVAPPSHAGTGQAECEPPCVLAKCSHAVLFYNTVRWVCVPRLLLPPFTAPD